MIWCKNTIRDRMAERIEPEPVEPQFQPASLDLRIGGELYDPTNDEFFDELTFKPGRFYIGHTLDYVEMPTDVAGVLTGRSSVGRNGVVVHCTAGFIDPSFCGQITLEICNFSGEEVTFQEGDRVCQLFFMQLDEATDGYDGQYQGQQGITRAGDV